MLHLDYSLSPSWNTAIPIDFAAAEVSDLHYSCFFGDIIFIAGDLDLSAQWGWVPVLDFAVCVDAVVRGLSHVDGAEDTYEFTESAARISFRRNGDSIEIESNYVEGTATVDDGDLRAATNQFLVRVLGDLRRQNPFLGGNPFVVDTLSAALSASAEQAPVLNPDQIAVRLAAADWNLRKSVVAEVTGRADQDSRRVQWRLLCDADRAVIQAMADALLAMADVDSVVLVCKALRRPEGDEGVWQTLAWSIKVPLDFEWSDVAGVLREVVARGPGSAREGALDALDWLGLITDEENDTYPPPDDTD